MVQGRRQEWQRSASQQSPGNGEFGMSRGHAEQSEPSNKRKTIILIVALAALAIAAVAVGWRNREEKQPDTPESAMTYICTECKHVYALTPAGYEKLSREGGIKAPDNRESGGIVLFRCPSCGKFAAVPAVECPNDGTKLPRRLPNGRPGRCPKCNWSFYPR